MFFFVCLVLFFSSCSHYLLKYENRSKEPWAEMVDFLRSKNDFNRTLILSCGVLVKGKFTLQYYLPENEVKEFSCFGDSTLTLDSFYLVQTNGHDRISKIDSVKLSTVFNIETTRFGFEHYGKGGTVTKYRKNNKAK
jgi:hypothetical protein